MFSIGARLKKLRERKGLKQTDVAKRFNVSRSSISQYETDNRLPSLERLIAFSRVYGVTTDYILGVTDREYIEVTGLKEKQLKMLTEMRDQFLTMNKIVDQRSDKT